MPNYGDYRLNLKADWNRRNVFNSMFVAMTIGHTNGVAEVRLEKDPDKVHAFAWVDPERREEVDTNLDDGYTFVTKADGWVSERYQWRADDRLYYQGQVLMAIPAEKYDELEKDREKYYPTFDHTKEREQIEEIAKRFNAGTYVPEGYEPQKARKGVVRSRS